MNQAFYTGISGIQTHQFGLDVVADNISNINTIGFKSSNAEFTSLFEDALNDSVSLASLNSIGMGSRVQTTATTLEYGSLLKTDSATDFAIGGDGWFGVTSGAGDMFTRAGAFTFDKDRNLVSNEGMYLLGTLGTNMSDGVLTEIVSSTALGAPSAQNKMTLPVTLKINPVPTTQVDFSGNLNSQEPLIRQSASVISPDGTNGFLQLEYTKSAVQPAEGVSWDIAATLSSQDGETVYDTQSGVAIFDTTGAIESYTLGTLDNNGQVLTVNLGEEFSGVTSIENLGVSYRTKHDGRAEGSLVGYDVNIQGEVVASFDNGISSSVGRVAIFHFQNDQGLERVSGTHFKESSNSGTPIFYKDADGNFILGSELRSFTLENSNLRFESGLTELIVLQRAFDANAKSITTGDELIKKALEMDG